MIRFEPATLRHARLIAPIMRPRDVLEIRQLHGREPMAAMAEALAASFYARTMFYGFEPLCMYGLAPMTLLADTARAWIFSTSVIDRYPLTFARASLKAMGEVASQCDRLTNLVALDDEPVVKWARWLGCTLVLPYQEHGGRLFAQFVHAGRGEDQCRSG